MMVFFIAVGKLTWAGQNLLCKNRLQQLSSIFPRILRGCIEAGDVKEY